MDIHTFSVSVASDVADGLSGTSEVGAWVLTILIIVFGGVAVVVGCYYWRCRRRLMAEERVTNQSTIGRSFYPRPTNHYAQSGDGFTPMFSEAAYPALPAGRVSIDDAIPPTVSTFADSGGPVPSSSRV
jgi:hypothetical protein